MQERSMSISRGYSGDIFTLLDSIDSEDEEDLENMMNGSDTEFVAEDRSVISTNIIRKEEIGDQSSSVSVSEASIHILSTQNEDETNSLGKDGPNSTPATQSTCKSPSPATQHTSNQLPSPAFQRPANQSPSPACQRIANQSPADVVIRHTSDQSPRSTPSPTVTLPKNTKKRKQSSMIKEKKKKEKVNAPSDENNTNQKKDTVPQNELNQRRKKPIQPRNGNRSMKKSL